MSTEKSPHHISEKEVAHTKKQLISVLKKIESNLLTLNSLEFKSDLNATTSEEIAQKRLRDFGPLKFLFASKQRRVIQRVNHLVEQALQLKKQLEIFNQYTISKPADLDLLLSAVDAAGGTAWMDVRQYEESALKFYFDHIKELLPPINKKIVTAPHVEKVAFFQKILESDTFGWQSFGQLSGSEFKVLEGAFKKMLEEVGLQPEEVDTQLEKVAKSIWNSFSNADFLLSKHLLEVVMSFVRNCEVMPGLVEKMRQAGMTNFLFYPKQSLEKVMHSEGVTSFYNENFVPYPDELSRKKYEALPTQNQLEELQYFCQNLLKTDFRFASSHAYKKEVVPFLKEQINQKMKEFGFNDQEISDLFECWAGGYSDSRKVQQFVGISSDSNTVLFFHEEIRNFQAMTELEIKNPGICKVLYDEFGTRLYRYDLKIFLSMYETRNDEVDYVFVAESIFDNTGAYAAEVNTEQLREFYYFLKVNKIALRVVQCKSERDLVRWWLKFKRRYYTNAQIKHKAKSLVLRGHGLEDKMSMGKSSGVNKGEINVDDLKKSVTEIFVDNLEPGAEILADCCLTGAENGFMSKASHFGHVTHGFNEPVSGVHYNPTIENGQIHFAATGIGYKNQIPASTFDKGRQVKK